jgi:hypothetical protein
MAKEKSNDPPSIPNRGFHKSFRTILYIIDVLNLPARGSRIWTTTSVITRQAGLEAAIRGSGYQPSTPEYLIFASVNFQDAGRGR